MARQGKAGTALAVAALGSFFAGTVATLLVAVFAPPLTVIALKFSAAEYFSLMLLGLVSATAVAHGSILKALAIVVPGLLLGVGVAGNIHTGTPRFNFGITAYADGLSFVALAVGVFAIADILRNLKAGPDRTVSGICGRGLSAPLPRSCPPFSSPGQKTRGGARALTACRYRTF